MPIGEMETVGTFFVDEPTPDDGTDDDTTPTCGDDIQAAQEAAQTADGCSQQVAVLLCPRDETTTYEARNGCEIDALQDRGWTIVDDAPDDGPGTAERRRMLLAGGGILALVWASRKGAL